MTNDFCPYTFPHLRAAWARPSGLQNSVYDPIGTITTPPVFESATMRLQQALHVFLHLSPLEAERYYQVARKRRVLGALDNDRQQHQTTTARYHVKSWPPVHEQEGPFHLSEKGKNPSSYGVSGGGVLRNLQKNKSTPNECDPSSIEPDVGILSCGTSHYCLESQHSSLGGLCLRNADSMELPKVCIENDCDCSGIVDGIGIIENCQLMEDYCMPLVDYPGEATEACLTANATLLYEQPGKPAHVEYCYNIVKPYERSYCLTYTSAGTDDEEETCTLAIDTVNCSSCVTQSCPDDAGGERFEFDCSNTVVETRGNGCNEEYAVPIFRFLFPEADANVTSWAPSPAGTNESPSNIFDSGGNEEAAEAKCGDGSNCALTCKEPIEAVAECFTNKQAEDNLDGCLACLSSDEKISLLDSGQITPQQYKAEICRNVPTCKEPCGACFGAALDLTECAWGCSDAIHETSAPPSDLGSLTQSPTPPPTLSPTLRPSLDEVLDHNMTTSPVVSDPSPTAMPTEESGSSDMPTNQEGETTTTNSTAIHEAQCRDGTECARRCEDVFSAYRDCFGTKAPEEVDACTSCIRLEELDQDLESGKLPIQKYGNQICDNTRMCAGACGSCYDTVMQAGKCGFGCDFDGLPSLSPEGYSQIIAIFLDGMFQFLTEEDIQVLLTTIQAFLAESDPTAVVYFISQNLPRRRRFHRRLASSGLEVRTRIDSMEVEEPGTKASEVINGKSEEFAKALKDQNADVFDFLDGAATSVVQDPASPSKNCQKISKDEARCAVGSDCHLQCGDSFSAYEACLEEKPTSEGETCTACTKIRELTALLGSGDISGRAYADGLCSYGSTCEDKCGSCFELLKSAVKCSYGCNFDQSPSCTERFSQNVTIILRGLYRMLGPDEIEIYVKTTQTFLEASDPTVEVYFVSQRLIQTRRERRGLASTAIEITTQIESLSDRNPGSTAFSVISANFPGFANGLRAHDVDIFYALQGIHPQKPIDSAPTPPPRPPESDSADKALLWIGVGLLAVSGIISVVVCAAIVKTMKAESTERRHLCEGRYGDDGSQQNDQTLSHAENDIIFA